MQKLVLRKDGLYRHSPLDEAAWGRGNGFPALGLAMCLTNFPDDHPRRAELLKAFQNHMETLTKHQDPTGMWHQVIDREVDQISIAGTVGKIIGTETAHTEGPVLDEVFA